MSSFSDPIADLLTRIRNANIARHNSTTVPASRLKEEVLRILKAEGYIEDYRRLEQGPQGTLEVRMKYGPQGERIINKIVRASSPGCRVYRKAKVADRVLDGLGIAILSTSRGLLTDRDATRAGVGGEVLCKVW